MKLNRKKKTLRHLPEPIYFIIIIIIIYLFFFYILCSEGVGGRGFV